MNKIQAGNLDVELEYSTDCENWQPVDKDTTVFEENVLYEPGFTQVTVGISRRKLQELPLSMI